MIDHKVQVVQDYMEVLLASGFSVEEVLKRGTEYLEHYLYETHASTTEIDHNVDLLVAQTVLQVAKNLHIDAESQRQAYRRASTSAMPISAMEFKKLHEGMTDE